VTFTEGTRVYIGGSDWAIAMVYLDPEKYRGRIGTIDDAVLRGYACRDRCRRATIRVRFDSGSNLVFLPESVFPLLPTEVYVEFVPFKESI
jgi:hypothetical protein